MVSIVNIIMMMKCHPAQSSAVHKYNLTAAPARLLADNPVVTENLTQVQILSVQFCLLQTCFACVNICLVFLCLQGQTHLCIMNACKGFGMEDIFKRFHFVCAATC